MDESATGPQTESDWIDQLMVEESGPDLEIEDDEGIDVDQVEDTATPESDSPSGEEEGEDPEATEGDAEPEVEGDDVEAEVEPAEDDEVEDEEDESPGEPDELAEGEEEPEAEAEPADDDGEAPGGLDWQDWTGRADGEEIVLPGAQISKAGLFVPTEALGKLQEHLTDRGAVYRQINQLQARLKEKSGAEAKAETIVSFYKDLLGKSEEEQYEWFQNLRENAPKLLAEAEAAGQRERADSLEAQASEREQAEAWQRFEQVEAPQRVATAVDRLLELDEFKNLERDTLLGAVSELGITGLFQRVDTDDFQIRGHAVPKGGIILNGDAILRVARNEARVAQAKLEAAAQTAAAKSSNAKAKSGKRKKAPPAVRSSGTPAPDGKEQKAPESREDWEAGLYVDE